MTLLKAAFTHASVEMTADPGFSRRIRRLAFVSLIALWLVWLLAFSTTDLRWAISVCLAAGWLLMPAVLVASLRWPVLRYALAAPSLLVGVSLLALCVSALPEQAVARTGWLLLTAGIWFGGALGLWFWFRWAPVPPALDNPFSPGRWTLVGMHVALVVVGLALVGVGAVL